MKQIALPLSLDRQFSFDNFISAESDLIVASLKALIRGDGENQIGLWGDAASGKTHLLNASADFARRHGSVMQIYDGDQLRHCAVGAFGDYDDCDLLAIDNLDAIAGDAEWEAFFYQVMNRCREGELRFLFAMKSKPDDLTARLNDFRSRLQWGLLLQLPSHGEAEIRNILAQRAHLLGIDLSPEVISYLMTHYARDLSAQMAILRRLDETSLSHQRRITIPLIKTALQDRPGQP